MGVLEASLKLSLSLSYLIVLIGRDRHEGGFWVGDSGEGGELQPLYVVSLHHVDPGLVAVHRVQDYL